MVDQYKLINGQAKKYVTKELKDDENNFLVTTYRLPYMTMPRKQLNLIFALLYISIVILATT